MRLSSSELIFQHAARGVLRGELRAFFADLVAQAAGGRPVVCLITSDEELRRLNREFRGSDYPTDVLSFPAVEAGSAATADASAPLGELAISFDRAAAQAAELGHTADLELRVLMLHGVLHLTGLDHESDSGEMAREEAKWRKRLKLPVGLIERAHA